jgi:hypothetical protein
MRPMEETVPCGKSNRKPPERALGELGVQYPQAAALHLQGVLDLAQLVLEACLLPVLDHAAFLLRIPFLFHARPFADGFGEGFVFLRDALA